MKHASIAGLSARIRPALAALASALVLAAAAKGQAGGGNRPVVEVDSLASLAVAVRADGQDIRIKPGTYRFSDYLTDERRASLQTIQVPGQGRPILPMFSITGRDNRIEATGVLIEVDTALYRKLPQAPYLCTFVFLGSGNTLAGAAFQTLGTERDGGGGTLLCFVGERNALTNTTVRLQGSFPWGYGDLLGKGGPNLVPLRKQSGIRILGTGTTLRSCRVVNRAFGHCYYIQGGDDILLEDCVAEGVMRTTDDMLRDTSGPAYDLGFRSVYQNRDGRYVITPGYTKALTEDGFRTYGGAGSVTLRNCTALNTRAGFEIGAKDDATVKTVIENALALGCERAFLIGSHTIVRRSRGDIAHGPLLYLRGGRESDVELELVGEPPRSIVHALATIAGENHRVRLTTAPGSRVASTAPIYVGFGMPDHAEMSSPIRPAPTRQVTLDNEIAEATLLTSDTMQDCTVRTTGRTVSDAALRASPGSWGLPPSGIAGDKGGTR